MPYTYFKHDHPYVAVKLEKFKKIPYLYVEPKRFEGAVLPDELPLVIFYHGLTSNKDFKRFQAMTIASYGFRVILPDAIYHGDRGGIDFTDSGVIYSKFWEIVVQGIEESDEFLDFLAERYKVDKREITLIGSSMGSMIAAGIFMKFPEMKALAGINGAFAWQRAIDLNKLPTPTIFAEVVSEFDLSLRPEMINGRNVLILHGTDDDILPIRIQRAFYEALNSPHPFVKKIEYNNVNHRITTNMLEDLIDWLIQLYKI